MVVNKSRIERIKREREEEKVIDQLGKELVNAKIENLNSQKTIDLLGEELAKMKIEQILKG